MLVRDTGEKIQILGKDEMISMNPETGHTYYINFLNNSIRDITYKDSISYYRSLVTKDCKPENKDKVITAGLRDLRRIFDQRNIPIFAPAKQCIDWPKRFISVNSMLGFCTALRFPYCIDKERKEELIYIYQLTKNHELRRLKPEYSIFQVLDTYNIKAKKATIRLLRDNISNITKLPQMSLFEKADNQLKIVDCDISGSTYYFLKNYLKYQDENNVANKLSARNNWHLSWLVRDIGRMYVKVKDRSVLKEKDIERLHDILAILMKSVEDKEFKQPFKYKDYAKEKECVIDGIKFWLPEDAQQMHIISEKMGNCISGYVDTVRHGQETILVMDDYKAALSFRGNKVVQAFGKHNRTMDDKYMNAFNTWCENYQMDSGSCAGVAYNGWF